MLSRSQFIKGCAALGAATAAGRRLSSALPMEDVESILYTEWHLVSAATFFEKPKVSLSQGFNADEWRMGLTHYSIKIDGKV